MMTFRLTSMLMLVQFPIAVSDSFLSPLLVAEHSAGSTCGMDASTKVPDCDMEDKGSCGNACCTVDVHFPKESPKELYRKLKEALDNDNEYAYVSGKMPHDEHPTDDLTKFDMKWKYIVSGTHTTSKRKYVDMLKFNIRANDDDSGGSYLRAFSISETPGALGDNGQNYKNLKFLVDSMKLKSSVKVIDGCGKSK
eukprot:TRINITY_DN5088_c0_g2_i1.p1 TRINITY_DN5088_c0_g2~~TRINITY_DN5088_c0_g2_i1.p1  ORF type:complete len:195 (+),score=29.73 TRINITY_DN5088_c0_g2_i1:47-631(+)